MLPILTAAAFVLFVLCPRFIVGSVQLMLNGKPFCKPIKYWIVASWAFVLYVSHAKGLRFKVAVR